MVPKPPAVPTHTIYGDRRGWDSATADDTDCVETSLLQTPLLFAGWVSEASSLGRSCGTSTLEDLLKESWAGRSILTHFLPCNSGVDLKGSGLIIGA